MGKYRKKQNPFIAFFPSPSTSLTQGLRRTGCNLAEEPPTGNSKSQAFKPGPLGDKGSETKIRLPLMTRSSNEGVPKALKCKRMGGGKTFQLVHFAKILVSNAFL